MSIENSFCLKFFYLGFLFSSALQYLDCCCTNIQWSKQPPHTWSCLWNLINLTYFWISTTNSSMEGDEGGIFSKPPDWKPLFLLKVIIEQNPRYPNKGYNVIFIQIHQTITAYPRVKRNRAKRGVGKQVLCVPNTVGGIWKVVQPQENCANFTLI